MSFPNFRFYAEYIDTLDDNIRYFLNKLFIGIFHNKTKSYLNWT